MTIRKLTVICKVTDIHGKVRETVEQRLSMEEFETKFIADERLALIKGQVVHHYNAKTKRDFRYVSATHLALRTLNMKEEKSIEVVAR